MVVLEEYVICKKVPVEIGGPYLVWARFPTLKEAKAAYTEIYAPTGRSRFILTRATYQEIDSRNEIPVDTGV